MTTATTTQPTAFTFHTAAETGRILNVGRCAVESLIEQGHLKRKRIRNRDYVTGLSILDYTQTAPRDEKPAMPNPATDPVGWADWCRRYGFPD